MAPKAGCFQAADGIPERIDYTADYYFLYLEVSYAIHHGRGAFTHAESQHMPMIRQSS
jgi:hypothetical protein